MKLHVVSYIDCDVLLLESRSFTGDILGKIYAERSFSPKGVKIRNVKWYLVKQAIIPKNKEVEKSLRDAVLRLEVALSHDKRSTINNAGFMDSVFVENNSYLVPKSAKRRCAYG